LRETFRFNVCSSSFYLGLVCHPGLSRTYYSPLPPRLRQLGLSPLKKNQKSRLLVRKNHFSYYCETVPCREMKQGCSDRYIHQYLFLVLILNLFVLDYFRLGFNLFLVQRTGYSRLVAPN